MQPTKTLLGVGSTLSLIGATLAFAGCAVDDGDQVVHDDPAPGVIYGGLVPQDVAWANVTGVTATGNDLTKTAAQGWGNAGACSSFGLATGVEGYAEFTLGASPGYAMFGLSNGDTDLGYADIDYGFYTYPPNGRLYIYENGTYRANPASYSAGDILRVSVDADVITYRRNGTVIYTSSITPTYPLRVDTSLYSNGATVADAVIAGDLVDLFPVVPESVAWTNATGVTATGNDLVKTASQAWGNAGASSTRGITVGGDGYAEFTLGTSPGYAMFGLSNGDTDQGYADIDYAFYTYPPNGRLYVYENGTQRGFFGTYAAGDVLRVSVDAGVVTYYRNGTLLRTSTVTPTLPLRVDTALYSVGANVNDAVLSGDVGDVTVEAVTWQGAVGVSAVDNDLTKTASQAWGNAGATSTRGISSSGYMEFTVPASGGLSMVGLSNGDSGQGYADVDFAFYPYTVTGALYVFEGGVSRGTVSTFTAGDVLRISVNAGTVTYSKNGSVVRTSSATPTLPLRVDTSLYSAGALVTDVFLAGDLVATP